MNMRDLMSYVDRLEGRSKLKRKIDFLPYFEPFRALNENEIKTVYRLPDIHANHQFIVEPVFVSYQALPGGFTICNIIVNGRLYSGSSHCSKVDQWLPIRGQMLSFKRALESTGISLPINLPNNEF